MEPWRTPKQNSLPIKAILFIVLGAVVLIGFILQKTNPRLARVGPSISSNSSILCDVSVSAPAPITATQNEHIERYPVLESPESAAADDFPAREVPYFWLVGGTLPFKR